MKVEVLCFNDENELQDEVNTFFRELSIQGSSIIDVKFSTCAYPWGDTRHYEPSFSAMILYK